MCINFQQKNFFDSCRHSLYIESLNVKTDSNILRYHTTLCAPAACGTRTQLVNWNHVLLKPKSDMHCNRSATSLRPKFITIAEVAEESQLGFAVGRRLVGDWSATDRGLVAD